MAKYKPTRVVADLEWWGPFSIQQVIDNDFPDDVRDVAGGIYAWYSRKSVFLGLMPKYKPMYVGQSKAGITNRQKQHAKSKLIDDLLDFQEDAGTDILLWISEISFTDANAEHAVEILDTVERFFIVELDPKFNSQNRVRAKLPFAIDIRSKGQLPPMVKAKISRKSGEYVSV